MRGRNTEYCVPRNQPLANFFLAGDVASNVSTVILLLTQASRILVET
jgi:hypothetical protein